MGLSAFILYFICFRLMFHQKVRFDKGKTRLVTNETYTLTELYRVTGCE